MATFKEIKANTIYTVQKKGWSENWDKYKAGYYMTLDTMEAIKTPNGKATVYQEDDNGEFVTDEDGYKMPQLDDNGEEIKEFYYSRSSKKGSIWMIKVPAVDIESVAIMETQTVLEDECYWDDPNVPEYYDKEVCIGYKPCREVGERPELDPNDLHLVQTKHIGWAYSDDLEELYQSKDENYLERQAEKSAEKFRVATNKRKIAQLEDATWNLFLEDDGDKVFFWEDGDERNRRYYEDGTGSRHFPKISYKTLFAVDNLISEVEHLKEVVDLERRERLEIRDEKIALSEKVEALEAQISIMEERASHDYKGE